MLKLFEISAGYNYLVDLLDTAETDGLIQKIYDLLQLKRDEAERAIEQSALILKNIESENTAIQNHINNINNRLDMNKNKIERIKSAVSKFMAETGITKVHTDFVTCALRTGVSRVNVVDEKLLPEKYKKTSVSINKIDLRADLIKGAEIEGANLIVGDDYIVIKI